MLNSYTTYYETTYSNPIFGGTVWLLKHVPKSLGRLPQPAHIPQIWHKPNHRWSAEKRAYYHD